VFLGGIPMSVPKALATGTHNPLTFRDHWGENRLLAYLGEDVEGDRVGAISFEWPELIPPQRKTAMEQLHLERFLLDHERGVGGKPFTFWRRGPEDRHPDFLVRGEEGEESGLDVTQLVLPDRVEAHNAFQRLRSAVLQRPRRTFRSLRGLMVWVALRDEVQDSITASVANAMEALVDVGASDDPPPYAAGFGTGMLSTTVLRAAPRGSSFYGVMGFELALSFGSAIYRDEAWQELQRLVTRKDQAGTHRLVVSFCAPVRDGFVFPSDVVTAALIEEASETASLVAKNIREVYLHAWHTRSIHLLTPGVQGAERLCVDDVVFRENQARNPLIPVGDPSAHRWARVWANGRFARPLDQGLDAEFV
jgi:hypothetical protein